MKRRILNKLLKKKLSNNNDYADILLNEPAIIHDMIDFSYTQNPHNERGHINLVVAMEELSELQKEISKGVRGKLDKTALMEEMVDVEHVLMTLKDIYHISDRELDKFRYIKTKRIKNKVESKTFF